MATKLFTYKCTDCNEVTTEQRVVKEAGAPTGRTANPGRGSGLPNPACAKDHRMKLRTVKNGTD